MMRRQCTRRRSFTLVEVLVALALAIALLSSVFTFYFNVLNTRKRLLDRSEQYRAATTVIDRVEAELFVSIASYANNQPGVRGDDTSLTIASRAVAASLAGRGQFDPAVYTDTQVTAIAFEPGQRQVNLARWSAGDEQSRSTSSLGRDISKLRFRYFDGSRWRDSFNSVQTHSLPQAVEIAIWFDRPDDEDAARPADEQQSTGEDDAGFDEFEFAMREDRGFEREPLPDRLRIIRIPDAAAQESDSSVNRAEVGP